MRPKKVILLVDPNEERAGLNRFVLANSGFNVFTASSVDHAKAGIIPDVFVGFEPIDETHLADLARKSLRPCLFVAKDEQSAKRAADRTLIEHSIATMDLLDTVKILTVRKRGPMKGQKRKPVAGVDDTLAIANAECC